VNYRTLDGVRRSPCIRLQHPLAITIRDSDFLQRKAFVKSIVTRVSGANSTEIVVLPPAGAQVPGIFRNVISNAAAYRTVLAQVQRFRGRIYLEDGAIMSRELTPDGRHMLPIDYRSWHVIGIEKDGEISGCLRFLEESGAMRFEDLWLHSAAIAHCPAVGPKVRQAVEDEMARARREDVHFGEVGGWAISADHRCGWEALRIVLSTYGLLQLLGGCVGLATATVRHGSAKILRKIGLAGISADDGPLAPYYEPQYGCLMEMLRFDSRRANERFTDWIEELTSCLPTAPVIASVPSTRTVRTWTGAPVRAAWEITSTAVA
jgi:hypothetical protein